MKSIISITAIYLGLFIGTGIIGADNIIPMTDSVQINKSVNVEQKTKTVYGVDGRPVNQSQYAKGFHRIHGTSTMVNGVDTITLNTSTANGDQDVSFIGDSTYFGMARSISVNGYTYTIVPISGKKFVVVSSDTTDTATVRFTLEGE